MSVVFIFVLYVCGWFIVHRRPLFTFALSLCTVFIIVYVVFQIPATTTRILLNHFKWDKEKLMERFYDTDQDQLFNEARVINPFKKGAVIRPKVQIEFQHFI